MVTIIRRTRGFIPSAAKLKSRFFKEECDPTDLKLASNALSANTSPATSASSLVSIDQNEKTSTTVEGNVKAGPSGSTSSLPAVLSPVRSNVSSRRNSADGTSRVYGRSSAPLPDRNIVGLNGVRFHVPRSGRADELIKDYLANGITHVVRTNGSSDRVVDQLNGAGFQIHDLRFKSGELPSADLMGKWLNLINAVFPKTGLQRNTSGNTIAIYGLDSAGTTPFLILVALVETGTDPWDAIALLRTMQRGSVSQKQMAFARAHSLKDGEKTQKGKSQKGKNQKDKTQKVKPQREVNGGRSRFGVGFLTPRNSSDRSNAAIPFVGASNRSFQRLSDLKTRAFRRSPKSTPGTTPGTTPETSPSTSAVF